MNTDTVSEECLGLFCSQCQWSSCACGCHMYDDDGVDFFVDDDDD